MHRFFHAEYKKPDSEFTGILRADASEESTIDNTMKGILELPGFEHIAHGPLGEMEFRKKIRNYVSYVIQEETVILPYTMQHPPHKGTQTPQKMLFIPIFS